MPTWFPGAGFKKKALKAKFDVDEMINWPFEKVKRQMVSMFICIKYSTYTLQIHGTAVPSLVSIHLDHEHERRTPSERESFEYNLKNVAGTAYEGLSH